MMCSVRERRRNLGEAIAQQQVGHWAVGERDGAAIIEKVRLMRV